MIHGYGGVQGGDRATDIVSTYGGWMRIVLRLWQLKKRSFDTNNQIKSSFYMSERGWYGGGSIAGWGSG